MDGNRRKDTVAPVEQLTKAGALPVKWVNGELEMLLVTSISRRNWIIPKGNIDEGFTLREQAAVEAFEEAGVSGSLSPEPFGLYYAEKATGYEKIVVYVLHVVDEYDIWPDKQRRDRMWVPAGKAPGQVSNVSLADLLKRCGQVLTKDWFTVTP